MTVSGKEILHIFQMCLVKRDLFLLGSLRASFGNAGSWVSVLFLLDLVCVIFLIDSSF